MAGGEHDTSFLPVVSLGLQPKVPRFREEDDDDSALALSCDCIAWGSLDLPFSGGIRGSGSARAAPPGSVYPGRYLWYVSKNAVPVQVCRGVCVCVCV